jgi:hypothetical protein
MFAGCAIEGLVEKEGEEAVLVEGGGVLVVGREGVLAEIVV